MRAGNERECLIAWTGPRERDPPVDTCGSRHRFQPLAVGAVPHDDQPRRGNPCDCADRDVQGLLAREPADEHERAGLELGRRDVERGRRVWQYRHAPPVEPPGDRDLGQVRAGHDNRAGLPEHVGAEALEQPGPRPEPGRWNSSSVPSNSP